MTGWLIVNGFLHSQKFDELADLFMNAARKHQISLQIVKNSDLLVENSQSQTEYPDFVIFWDKDILLAKYLEQKGVAVFNSSEAIAVCDDKRKSHLACLKYNLPVPKTIFAPMTYSGIGFTDYEFLKEIEKELSFPIVVKEAFGSFGAQVYLAKDEDALQEIVKTCSTTEILFQEYIEESKGRDIRLQVVGENVIGCMYRYSENDFRANLTNGGKMKPYTPTREECELAIKATQATGAVFAGVDLLFGKDGPVVCEVNSNAHFKNLLDCTGIDTSEKIIQYILEWRKLC